jgi:flavin-dependent dehydrogenase
VDLTSDTPAALMIRRLDFDALLADLAREAGADVVTGAEVVAGRHGPDGVAVATRDGRRFEARYLIACDGVHRVTARRLGIAGAWPREALAIDMMEETPNASLSAVDPGCLWVQYGCPAPAAAGDALWEGYGYVFPKRDHVNVGLGYLLSPYRDAAPGPAYAAHRGFVERLARQRVLAGESRRDRFTPFLIPVAGPRALGAGRVLLAGDAAGFVHGLTAEGIYYAMVSGDLAAGAVARTLRDSASAAPGVALSRFTRAWRTEVGQELRDSVLLQRYLFGSPDRVAAVIAGASEQGAVTAATVRYLAGQAAYRRVRSLALSHHPGLVLSLTADAIGRLWRSFARAALL